MLRFITKAKKNSLLADLVAEGPLSRARMSVSGPGVLSGDDASDDEGGVGDADDGWDFGTVKPKAAPAASGSAAAATAHSQQQQSDSSNTGTIRRAPESPAADSAYDTIKRPPPSRPAPAPVPAGAPVSAAASASGPSSAASAPAASATTGGSSTASRGAVTTATVSLGLLEAALAHRRAVAVAGGAPSAVAQLDSLATAIAGVDKTLMESLLADLVQNALGSPVSKNIPSKFLASFRFLLQFIAR